MNLGVGKKNLIEKILMVLVYSFILYFLYNNTNTIKDFTIASIITTMFLIQIFLLQKKLEEGKNLFISILHITVLMFLYTFIINFFIAKEISYVVIYGACLGGFIGNCLREDYEKSEELTKKEIIILTVCFAFLGFLTFKFLS
ncbi:hypothetical protein R9X47_26580 [Wukongibacter baidiensis]|uniref:hypothetical protein n=1 Tax=Wukongibacter baidiensis TaxID=1723361 RepID=UPI003D7F1E12